jgi:hypothetical protein
MNDARDTLWRLARGLATGPAAGPPPAGDDAVNPQLIRALRTGGAVLVGSAILGRSRLARLAVAGGAVAYASRRGARSDGWQDVPPPSDPA